jgi:modified peptide precursor CbpA
VSVLNKGAIMEKSKKRNNSGSDKYKKDVIATRKTCKADGVGLSHYILVDQKAK